MAQWGFLGREPSEIWRLAAGLWYTGRRDLLTALYSLLRVSSARTPSFLGIMFVLAQNLAFVMFFISSSLLVSVVLWILQAVVLDSGLEADLVADIQKYLEDLINAGLRQRLISLIKVLTFVACYLFCISILA